MTSYRISTLLLIVWTTTSLCAAAAESAGEERLTRAVGKMLRAEMREITDASNHVSKPRGETMEEVLLQLRAEWKRFTWRQKKEFVLISLTKCDIQGGASTLLLQLVGEDGVLLQRELATIPDAVLRDRMRLSKEGIATYRAKLAYLAGK